jgi:hypothetical protein
MGTKTQKFNCDHEKVGKIVILTLEEVKDVPGPSPRFVVVDCDSRSLCGHIDDFVPTNPIRDCPARKTFLDQDGKRKPIL